MSNSWCVLDLLLFAARYVLSPYVPILIVSVKGINVTVVKIEDVPVAEFMYLAFTRMPGESYRRRLRSLLLYFALRISSAN